jgi:hypothetical protein
MDPVTAALAQLGISIAAQTIYDVGKKVLSRGGSSKENLASELASEIPSLSIENAKVIADTLVDVFAEHGDITIRGTEIHAKDSVWMRSAPGTQFSFGHGSTSSTERTRIETRGNSEIRGTGGAEIRQNDDGSISFHT